MTSAFTAGALRMKARLPPTWSLAASVLAVAVSVGVALVERDEAPSTAADIVLSEAVFAWVLPLLAYYAVGRAAEQGRVDRAVESLARHGTDRRQAFMGFVTGLGLRVSGVAVLATACAVIAARGVHFGAFPDVLTSSWIAVVGALCYTALFALGSLFGSSGQGRGVLLVLDLVFGSVPETAGPFPRAHLQSLIGGEAVFGLGAGGAVLVLCGILAGCVALQLWRVPP
jgi:hypothetical protein